MKWRGVLIAESLVGDHVIWDRVEVRGRSKSRLEREGSRGALHPSGYRFAGPCMVLLGLLALAAVPAQAEMPADALVMAKDISDIITLDPAEAFELTTGELLANVYDRIMTFEPEDPTVLTGGVAESHAVSDDGSTVTFRIRDGLTFHSGNPVRPEDVEFSLERAVLLGRSPSFIVTQFGWNADNVGELIEVVDDRRVRITIAEGFSPGLVLNALSAGVASVVDRGARPGTRAGRRPGQRLAADQQRRLRSVPGLELEGRGCRGPGSEPRPPSRPARCAARGPSPRERAAGAAAAAGGR